MNLRNRAQMENALELLLDAAHGLISELDAQDGDPDLEPSLGHHPVGRDASLVDLEGAAPELSFGRCAVGRPVRRIRRR